nr:type II toxin-antitoxin system RelE/ParE family toxin [Pseudoxanthomonas spadix]
MGGTREWRVARTPYLLVYRQGVDALEVLHVWHEAQDWMSRTE